MEGKPVPITPEGPMTTWGSGWGPRMLTQISLQLVFNARAWGPGVGSQPPSPQASHRNSSPLKEGEHSKMLPQG